MDPTPNPGDLRGNEDLPALRPGGSEALPADASAVISASQQTAADNIRTDPNHTPIADFARQQGDRPPQYPAGVRRFVGLTDNQLQQMPDQATVMASGVLEMAHTLPARRVDHDEIEGEYWFITNWRRSRSIQEVTSTLDRLENLILGPLHETSTCSICLEDYVEGDRLVVLPCHESHIFHRKCLNVCSYIPSYILKGIPI
ncbi:hypothetical protein PtA15_3A243 [Puccinia triticina]|uniref:RING-type domain-containing protein n=1 Tax=Puccinia triticina TaxID=208348 RepID=A0ABY7CD82_9BASI|nr:uncharacterized protein PtA15_3A243 [Puccinia triticina]WAQ82878.1 hypothetical protein PtA15_3A243 [Puccinia triticina]WAR53703.1 hypothetical protein PtB15_3B212 [Puccinia triticina]